MTPDAGTRWSLPAGSQVFTSSAAWEVLVRRVAAALWTAGWLVVLLVVTPWALLVLVGIPVPRHPPQEENLREWIVVLAVLFLWVIWLLLLALVGLHVRAAVHWVRLRRLRLANPPEGLAAGLLGAAVVAATTAGSRGAISTPPAPPAAELSLDLAVQPPAATQPGADTAKPTGPTADQHEPATAGQPGSEITTPQPAARVRHQPDPATGPPESLSGTPVEHALPAGENAEETTGADPRWTRWTSPEIGADAGVALPDGGWVDRHTAAAVSAAAGLLWLRRRRRYVPRPPSGSRRRDADLTALPDTAAAIVDRLHSDQPDPTQREQDRLGVPIDHGSRSHDDHGHDDHGRDDHGRDDRDRGDGEGLGRGERWADPTASSETMPTPAEVTVAALGQARDGPLRPADLPVGGVGLTGLGATDAARGILTAALLTGAPGNPELDTQVLTTTDDVATLLRPGMVGHARPSGLNVFTDVEELLAAVETQLLHRIHHWTTQPGPDAAGTTAAADAAADGGPFPPLLIVTAPPAGPGPARRLAVLLTHTAGRLDIRGVLLGAWPLGATWQVNPDGTIGLTANANGNGRRPAVATGARLCVLSATAATDLLTLQAQARPDRFQLHPTSEAPRASGQAPPAGQPAAITTGSDTPPAADRRTGVDAAGPAGVSTVLVDGDRDGRRAAAPLRLRLLGGAALYRSDDLGSPLRLGRSAALQVLVFLALHPDGATSHDLAAALWPGVRPRPTDRVYTAASTLRTALARVTDADVEVLTRNEERYQLNHHLLQVDLWTLHTAVDLAAAAGDPATRTEALRTIIRCYTGELAAGRLWLWIGPYREATRRHVIDAYTTLADITLAGSTVPDGVDPSTAVELLRAALMVEPANEDLHRRAAAALAAAGQPTAARRRARRVPPTPGTGRGGTRGDHPSTG